MHVAKPRRPCSHRLFRQPPRRIEQVQQDGLVADRAHGQTLAPDVLHHAPAAPAALDPDAPVRAVEHAILDADVADPA